MPIYKMEGKKNGKQKYRVRINYTDSFGKSKQIDRVVYGLDEAKELERRLQRDKREVVSGLPCRRNCWQAQHYRLWRKRNIGFKP